MKKVSQNPKETEQIAKIFLEKILKNKVKKNGAIVVGLYGDLGAGKTTFVKSLGKHLGIKNTINSPTFVILKKYKIKPTDYKFLFHIDAYRLKNEKDLLALGWEEIIGNKENLIFIEWPENVAKVIPKNATSIHIYHEGKDKRNLELK